MRKKIESSCFVAAHVERGGLLVHWQRDVS